MAYVSWISCPIKHSKPKPLPAEDVQEHPLRSVPQADNARLAISRSTLRSGSTGPSTKSSTRTYTPLNSLSRPIGNPLSSKFGFDGSDPLTQFASEEVDPLSKIVADEWDYSLSSVPTERKTRDSLEVIIDPWSTKRSAILSKYTTSEKLSIVTSFLSGGEKFVRIQPATLVDKVRNRLEQLDDFEEGSVRQMLDLSQQEYAQRIGQLNNELVQAWHSDQRVKALKIAIQCAKLLVDTSGMAFYPSKFVLITDILDIFGKLVFERLKMKAGHYLLGSKLSKSLPDHFTTEMVPENAKETCKNWFYKIASIRELVPRLYLEMAIIKSYSFLTNSEFSTALPRITKMIRGIGNPLIAVYARCFLCRMGLAITRCQDIDFVYQNFLDFLSTYHQLFGHTVKAELTRQNISLFSYLNLYIPALDWILQLLAQAPSSESILIDILPKVKHQKNWALILNSILIAFKPTYISLRALEFVNLISECNEDSEFPQYILYRSLEECLIKEAPPKEVHQQLYQIIWSYITDLSDPWDFMYCMEIWIQFVIQNFSVKDLNDNLTEIIVHLEPNRGSENFYPQLQSIIGQIVSRTQDFESLLIQDNFLPLINLFHKESVKVEVCKNIIEGFGVQQGTITDPIIINALMFIARVIHDSVSALTVEDEKRQIGNLISGFVQRVNYGRDFEKQLNFHAEARATFPNLDSVHIQLVQCVNCQAVKTRKIVRGHHTRRTSAFVRACAAFCFITIPSLISVQIRLQLYLLSGQVALLNQCFGQADACFKAALYLVPEMPKSIDIDGGSKNSEVYLLSYLSNFLSTLLVVPDSPEHGVLYLMRGLLNIVHRCFHENSFIKCQLYLRVLDVMAIVTQEYYPYHVDKVDSNDTLYGSDSKFISEVNKICTKILEEIMGYLKVSGNSEQQSSICMELFGRLIMRADMRHPELSNLAVNLWNLSEKHGCMDSKMRIKTIEHLKKKSEDSRFEHLSDIFQKIMDE